MLFLAIDFAYVLYINGLLDLVLFFFIVPEIILISDILKPGVMVVVKGAKSRYCLELYSIQILCPCNLKRPREAATRGRNSRDNTVGASKCNGIRAKPQREHRNVTELARNHRWSVEFKDPSIARDRCDRQTKQPPQKRPEEGTRAEFEQHHSRSIETQRNSYETAAGISKRNGIRAKPQREHAN